MISIRRCLVCAAVVVAGLAAADEGVAGPGGDQLRARLDRVVGILEDRARRHWQAATPAERDELVRLFARCSSVPTSVASSGSTVSASPSPESRSTVSGRRCARAS
jgi:hypothetical protein